MRLFPLVPRNTGEEEYINPERVLSVGEYFTCDGKAATGIWFDTSELPTRVSFEPLDKFLSRLSDHNSHALPRSLPEWQKEEIDKFWSETVEEIATTLIFIGGYEWRAVGPVLTQKVHPQDVPVAYTLSSRFAFQKAQRYFV